MLLAVLWLVVADAPTSGRRRRPTQMRLIGSSVLLLDADGRQCRTSVNVLGVTSRVARQLSHVLGLFAVSRSGDQRLGDSQDNGRVEQPCRRVEHPRDAKKLLGYCGIRFGGGQDAIHISVDNPCCQ